MPSVIPVNNDGNREVEVSVSETATYRFRTYYSQGQRDAWFLDISDIRGNLLLGGIPIVPGSRNLLKGQGDTFKDEQLACVVLEGSEASPDALGNGTYLIWFNAGEVNPMVDGDPIVNFNPQDWGWGGDDVTVGDHALLSNRFIPDQHDVEAITGLRAELNNKASSAELNKKANQSYVDNKLAGKANTIHTQAISTITGLQSALDAKADKTDLNNYATITSMTSALAGKANSVHSHAISDVTNLQSSLNAKAPLASPAFTGTPTAPTAADGTNTTQVSSTAFVQAAVSGKADQVALDAKADKTYVDTQLGGKADVTHTQSMDTVTGLNTAMADKANVSDLANLATKTEVAAKANTADLKPMAYQNDAPTDGKEYNRKNGQWVEDVGGGGSGLPEGGNANDILAKNASNAAGWKTPAQLASTLPKGTETDFGVVKADGLTITSSGGILTAVGGSGGEGTSDHRQLSNRNAADQHSQAAITDLSSDLDAIRANVAAKADAAATTAALAGKANTTDVNTALAGKANAIHTQAISTITGLQSALDAKADKTDLNNYATTEALTAGLADKANTSDMNAALLLKAPLASPALTGTPTAPTPATSTNSTRIATTAFVKAQGYAPLASPAFTGTPTAPTAADGTNTTQVSSTAFVQAALNAKITYGTTDLEAGISPLVTGVLYVVYE